MLKPLCFVLMPFGKKPIKSGLTADFDAVYEDLIKPAIESVEMEALRADEELTGGSIHKPMFERLILCDFAVADLSGANANVFYELGLRHGVRPATTVLIFADTENIPFDVALLRAMPYKLGHDGKPVELVTAVEGLRKFLEEAKSLKGEPPTDSPVFQLVEGYRAPDIDRLKTDVFRDRGHYAAEARKQLAVARLEGSEAVRKAAQGLGEISNLEAGVVIDLFLSYRAVGDWQGMVDLVAKMPAPLAKTSMVREQLGLALNRIGKSVEAEMILTELIKERGPSSETNGILGRVYKDRWQATLDRGDSFTARGELNKAIETYLQGFETDWRDAYPGVNAVTLMELKDPPDPRRLDLLPVVYYAVQRRIAKGSPDYWDYATLLEIAVLGKDESKAMDAAGDTLAAVRESWEAETTANNLKLIRETRSKRGETVAWADEIEKALQRASSRK